MNETKFIKTKKDKNYTVLDNTFIQDTGLSWKSKGLMTYFLSLPDDWVIHFSEVEKHATDGKGALRSAINELKEHGYLKVVQRKEKGKFAEMVYTIIENPLSPFTDFPLTEKPLAENQTLQNTNNNKILNKQNTDDTNIASAEPTQEKPKKAKLLDREPKNDLEKVEKEYLLNYRELYQKGLLMMESPVINWNTSRKLTKDTIAKYGLETVLKAVKKSKENQFCIDRGYALTTILSAGVLAGLINGGKGKKSALDDFEHPDDIMDDVAF